MLMILYFLIILNMSMIILISAIFVDLKLKFNVFINTDLWHFVCVCYCDVILVYHANLTGGIFGLQSTTFQRIGFTSAKQLMMYSDIDKFVNRLNILLRKHTHTHTHTHT